MLSTTLWPLLHTLSTPSCHILFWITNPWMCYPKKNCTDLLLFFLYFFHFIYSLPNKENRQHPSGHLQSGWFAQVAKNGHVSFKNNELHAHTQQQNMYFLGMGPLPPLPFVTIPPHTLPNPVLSYSKKPSMAKRKTTYFFLNSM